MSDTLANAPAAAAALVAAIVARLADDPGVAALVGAAVHETPPRNATYPYLLVDTATSDDRSGVDAALTRHSIDIRAYGRDGKPAALAIAAAAAAALQSALSLAGHRLVLLHVGGAEARLMKDRLTAEARVSVSALTEPL